MAKEGKTLIQFNVKNGKYAIKASGDSWTIKELTWLTSFSKDKDLSTTDVYGDGEKVLTLINDKGFTGVLGMTAQDEEYNKDLGFSKELESGTAEVEQISVKEHAIYFETQYTGVDGEVKTKKVWVFGVETQAPSESYSQNEENINISNVNYNIIIKGTPTLATGGGKAYVDENGNTMRTYTLSAKPGDTGYATFGDTVPKPTVKGV